MAGLRMLLDPTKVGHGAETLERKLRKRIVGQDDAVRQIVGIYQTFLAGLSSAGRPIGSLLFLGPTGSGKTRTVEALAEALTGNPRGVIKIDCAEFQHSHEIAKLIGSPPGYLGHRETRPVLSQEALDQFQTEDVKLNLVLFDEIEKASDALWNLLLGILDKAILTLGDNRRVDFSRSIIFLTSNLGANEMAKVLQPKLGFAAADGEPDPKAFEKMAQAGLEAARRKFSPEFLNRLDGIVTFRALGEAELRRILELELDAVRERIAAATEARSLVFHVSKPAKQFLLAEGTDPRYGARHLRRAIDRLIVSPISNLIATAQVGDNDRLLVEFDPRVQRLVFFKESEEPAQAATATAA